MISKTQLDDNDLQQYFAFIEQKIANNFKLDFIKKLKEKLQNKEYCDYFINLIFDNNGKIIGSILLKFEDNVFGFRQCQILDIKISNNALSGEILDIFFKNIIDFSNKFSCQKILYLCLTKDKYLQQFFSTKKFTLEQFAFYYEIKD